MMNYSAILFDMGNTLLSYHPPHQPWRSAEEECIDSLYWELVGLGFCQRTSREAFVERMFTRLVRGWNEAIAGQRNLRLDQVISETLRAERVPLNRVPMEELVAIYLAPLRARVRAAEDAATTLTALRARGLPIGLLSNTFWPGTVHRADLAACGLLDLLDLTIFSADAERWKPDPELFAHAASELGVTPATCLFIGDSPNEDIRGAQAAGMTAIWLNTGEHSLGTVAPDHEITRLTELLERLN